jgi:hypothetical protein
MVRPSPDVSGFPAHRCRVDRRSAAESARHDWLTPFCDRRCLTVVMATPAHEIDKDDWLPRNGDPELDRRDARTKLVLGEPLSRGEFDARRQLEPPVDDDALTVVLRSSGEHVRCRGWLRAPRFAVVALLVLGAGVSIRVFRRQSDDDHIRAGTARHRVTEPGAGAAQKVGIAASAGRPRTSPFRHERRRPQGRRPPGRTRRDRTAWSARTDGQRLPRPTPQEPDDGAASAGGVPHVDDAQSPQAEARRSVPSRRPPCVPGTLGC